MNTKQMECVLEVSKTLNFNRAAENLFISQPALSYHIRAVEEEIGFEIFQRLGKGVSLSLAGKDFCASLEKIQKDLNRAIEHGQNLNRKYNDDISIGLPNRSAIYYLPEVIQQFSVLYPDIAVFPVFRFEKRLNSFLSRECDIYFSYDDEVKNIPNVITYPLFESKIYAVVKKEDELANKEKIFMSDLKDRTLIVGGKAPRSLKVVQRRVLKQGGVEYINSPDHGTTLLYIASNQGICLAPGFLNDHNDEFAWIPFDCEEKSVCVLSIHEHEKRKIVHDFIRLLQECYK